MPWEVHARQRLIKPAPYDKRSRLPFQKRLPTKVKKCAVEQWPPFYRYDYDLESLWWILLWTCLFRVPHLLAQGFGVLIFTYTSEPSLQRTDLMMTLEDQRIASNIPPQLEELVFFIHDLHATLYTNYASIPTDDYSYLEIHEQFWGTLHRMINTVSTMDDIRFFDPMISNEENSIDELAEVDEEPVEDEVGEKSETASS